MPVKCLALRKPSLRARCHSLPALPGSCPLNIFHAVRPQPPHQPRESLPLDLEEEGWKQKKQPFCGPAVLQAAFTRLCTVRLDLRVFLSPPCPAASHGNIRLILSLICSVPSSHPLAPVSLLRSSSPKSLSLEFQGPVRSPEWLFWAPLPLSPRLSFLLEIPSFFSLCHDGFLALPAYPKGKLLCRPLLFMLFLSPRVPLSVLSCLSCLRG